MELPALRMGAAAFQPFPLTFCALRRDRRDAPNHAFPHTASIVPASSLGHRDATWLKSLRRSGMPSRSDTTPLSGYHPHPFGF